MSKTTSRFSPEARAGAVSFGLIIRMARRGQTDMLACMRTHRDIDFDGVLRPDHVPTVEGDSNENAGYSAFGRLYAIGYIRGLREAVYAR